MAGPSPAMTIWYGRTKHDSLIPHRALRGVTAETQGTQKLRVFHHPVVILTC